MKSKKILGGIIGFYILFLMACKFEDEQNSEDNQLRKRCVDLIRDVLADESEWIKIHAAEYLLWSGNPGGVRELFLEEEKKFGSLSPYRIGIWRVLAQAASTAEQKKYWTDKIMAAFFDVNGTDRIYAAESLAKLKISPLNQEETLTKEALNGPEGPLSLYTQWSISFTSQDSLKSSLKKFINVISNGESEPLSKLIAAYAIRKMNGLSQGEWEKLAHLALGEIEGSRARVYMLSSAFITVPAQAKQTGLFARIHAGLLAYKDGSVGEIVEMSTALAEKGGDSDIPVLLPLLDNENTFDKSSRNADVTAAAAYAVLRIRSR